MSSPAADAASASDDPRPWLERVAGALTHRNYRLLWFAALGSTIGTWMQKFAQSLLIYDLTQSKFYLGLDDFLSQLPILLFMLIGGVVADRHDRRKLLTGSQYVQACSAFALAILVWTGYVHVALIFLLSFIAGCGQAFGGPAYQSLIPALVPRRDLPNAIALNSTQFNLSRVLGPSTGAVILATIGTAWCFAVNGLSFFFVVLALAALHLPAHTPPETRRAISAELKSGLQYVRETPLVRTLTVLVAISTFLAMPILTMLPAFAAEVLTTAGTPESRLSMLMAAQGLGAIVGAIIVGTIGTTPHMGRLLLGVQIGLGLLICSFALSSSLPLSLGLLFLGGIFFMALFSISFSIVQLAVPDTLRGRVVSIYMVALRGGGPIGGLAAGALADRLSTSTVMATNGILLAVLATGLLLYRRGAVLEAMGRS
ncbi:MAG: MFS transporter [Acidobacteria bacterium]|nr:MFS transporter [Acidobacteriota bacterium]